MVYSTPQTLPWGARLFIKMWKAPRQWQVTEFCPYHSSWDAAVCRLRAVLWMRCVQCRNQDPTVSTIVGPVFSSICHSRYPTERCMIISYCEAGSMQRRAQKSYSPFNCQTLSTCCDQLWLFIAWIATPLTNRPVDSVLLLLKEYISDSLSPVSVSSAYRSLITGCSSTADLMRFSHNVPTTALSFPYRRRKF